MQSSNNGLGERVFSVDDLVGGIWRLGQATTGFHRTDSEAAFQEFLKRIPSATNLAAAANQLDSASAAHLQQHLQQQGSGVLLSTSMGGGDLSQQLGSSGGGSMGMHRVPSLDFLKQLTAMQQMSGGQQGVKLEVPTPPPGTLTADKAVLTR
jgi:hypothetical protein